MTKKKKHIRTRASAAGQGLTPCPLRLFHGSITGEQGWPPCWPALIVTDITESQDNTLSHSSYIELDAKEREKECVSHQPATRISLEIFQG